MTDAISRDAALDTIEGVDWYHVNQKGNLVHGPCSDYESWVKYDEVISSIKNVPNLDVSLAVHARWIYSGDMDLDGNSQGYCSRCGAGDKHRADLKNFVPYCWKCGARMDAKSEEEG